MTAGEPKQTVPVKTYPNRVRILGDEDVYLDCDWCASTDIDPERRYYWLTSSDTLCFACCEAEIAEREAARES